MLKESMRRNMVKKEIEPGAEEEREN